MPLGAVSQWSTLFRGTDRGVARSGWGAKTPSERKLISDTFRGHLVRASRPTSHTTLATLHFSLRPHRVVASVVAIPKQAVR